MFSWCEWDMNLLFKLSHLNSNNFTLFLGYLNLASINPAQMTSETFKICFYFVRFVHTFSPCYVVCSLDCTFRLWLHVGDSFCFGFVLTRN